MFCDIIPELICIHDTEITEIITEIYWQMHQVTLFFCTLLLPCCQHLTFVLLCMVRLSSVLKDEVGHHIYFQGFLSFFSRESLINASVSSTLAQISWLGPLQGLCLC